ncbi:hypothetical protein QBC44DRAFT_380971 [Cladorrhinum sp. PSN332]|nr:hypothetical protein QBC44DRAFT_380971 [Cladorrhinum sp. PSN332]
MDGPPLTTAPSGLRTSLSMREHHHHHSPPSSTRAIDPPRPAREGFEWVWYPEGYWAEREYSRPSTPNKAPDTKIWKRRRRSRKSQSGSNGNGGHSSEGTPTTSPKAPLHMLLAATVPMTPQSPYLSESAHVYSLQNPREEVTASQDDQEGEWLSPKHRRSYASAPTQGDSPDRTDSTPPRTHSQFPSMSWNRLSHSFKSSRDLKKSEKSESSEQSQPEDVKMDTVKKFLDRLPEAEKPEPEGKASLDPPKSRRVRFGRVLWRKASGRTSSAIPASQKTDARPTPPPQIWLSQFPGGEATRVHTPPYKEDTAGGRPRSLFFDLNSPKGSNASSNPHNSGGESDSTTSTRRTRSNASSRVSRYNRDSSRSPVNAIKRNKSPVYPGTKRKDDNKKPSPVSSLRLGGRSNASQGSASREWWEQHRHQQQRSGNGTPVNGQKPGGRDRGKTNSTGQTGLFEFDMPEHLPSSPMCPANPKHVKSGGKGVCVYHGRRRSSRYLLPGSDSVLGIPDRGGANGAAGGMMGSEEDGNKSF